MAKTAARTNPKAEAGETRAKPRKAPGAAKAVRSAKPRSAHVPLGDIAGTVDLREQGDAGEAAPASSDQQPTDHGEEASPRAARPKRARSAERSEPGTRTSTSKRGKAEPDDTADLTCECVRPKRERPAKRPKPAANAPEAEGGEDSDLLAAWPAMGWGGFEGGSRFDKVTAALSCGKDEMLSLMRSTYELDGGPRPPANGVITGKRLRQVRESMHFPLRSLAQWANIAESSLRQMEKGSRSVPLLFGLWVETLGRWVEANPPPPKER